MFFHPQLLQGVANKPKLRLFIQTATFITCSFCHPIYAECMPSVSLGNIIQICQGNNVQLNAYNPGASYIWSTGDTSSSIIVNQSGTYSVTVTNTCGTATDSVNIIASLPINIDLGPDVHHCSTQQLSLTLSAPIHSEATYQWSTGASSSSINISQPGTYWVSASNACGTFRDTITIIEQLPNNIDLGSDTVICQANSYTLEIDSFSGNIIWNTGDTINTINVTSSGTYSVSVSNACGTISDSIHVFFFNEGLNLASPVHLCSGNHVNLDPGVSGFSYTWKHNGTTFTQPTTTQSGTYTVTIQTPCGPLTDSIIVSSASTPQIDNLPDTIWFCQGDSVLLAPTLSNSTSVQWSNGPATDSIYAKSQGKYFITASSPCGTSTDSVIVRRINRVRALNIVQEYYMCPGQNVVVDAFSGRQNTTYNWSNGGSNSSSRTFTQFGNYSVTLSDSCGQRTHHFSVHPPDSTYFTFPSDSIYICAENYTLNPEINHPTFSFLWSNNDTTPTITVSDSGWYSVTIDNGCESHTDSMYVDIDIIPNITTPSNVNICSGDTTVLLSTLQDGVKYEWSTGDTSNSILVSQGGWYSLMAYNRCDTVTALIHVEIDTPMSHPSSTQTHVLCDGDSINLTPQLPQAAHISWNHGASTETITIAQPGIYTYTAYNSCDSIQDTIIVMRDSIPSRILPDSVYLCGNQPVSLTASTGSIQTIWNDLTSSLIYVVNSPGTYYATSYYSCGSRTDTVVVLESTPINHFGLGNDTIFCSGTLVLAPLPSAPPGTQFLWNNNSTNSTFTVTQSGTYSVTATNACDTLHDTINVLITGAPYLNMGAFVYFCNGSDLLLDALNPGSTYLWSTGDTTARIEVNSPGMYSVVIENDCGTYVDSIEVRVDHFLDLNLGNDTVICKGDTLTLNSKALGHEIFLWSTGETQPEIKAFESNTYWARVDNACGRFFDTINVVVLEEPIFDISGKTNICTSHTDSVILSGPPAMYSYEWDDGSTDSIRIIKEAGTYFLTVNNGCYSHTDSITIDAHQAVYIDLGMNDVFCFDNPPILNPDVKNHDVVWQDGSIGEEFLAKETGWYSATVVNACGVFSDSVYLKKEYPINFDIMDTTFCVGESITIDIAGMWPNETVRWGDGYSSSKRRFNADNEVEYIVLNSCGEAHQTVFIESEVCDCPLYIANAFTPNGDGINDMIYPQTHCELHALTFRIFSRWGGMVFETNEQQLGWDGTIKGTAAQPGTYIFKLDYSFWDQGYLHHRKKRGQITLIR